MSIFPLASDARNGARSNLTIFTEVTYLEEKILLAIAAGSFSTSITDSYMTNASLASALSYYWSCSNNPTGCCNPSTNISHTSVSPTVTIGTIVSSIIIGTFASVLCSISGSIDSVSGSFVGVINGSLFPTCYSVYGVLDSVNGLITGSLSICGISYIGSITPSNRYCDGYLLPTNNNYGRQIYPTNGNNRSIPYPERSYLYRGIYPDQYYNRFVPEGYIDRDCNSRGYIDRGCNSRGYYIDDGFQGSFFPGTFDSAGILFPLSCSFYGSLGYSIPDFNGSISMACGSFAGSTLPSSCIFTGSLDTLTYSIVSGSISFIGGIFNDLILPSSGYLTGYLNTLTRSFNVSVLPIVPEVSIIPSITIGTIIPSITIGTITPSITIGTVITSITVSTLTPSIIIDQIDINIIINNGTLPAPIIGSGISYYQVWQNLTTNTVLMDQMNQVMTYFQNLGYTITQLTNSNTGNTFYWNIQW